jgi:hypothetical protein
MRKSLNKYKKIYKKNNGQTMVKQWSNSGQPMIKQWSTSGQPMVKQWPTNDQPVVNQWSTNGQRQPIGQPMVNHNPKFKSIP